MGPGFESPKAHQPAVPAANARGSAEENRSATPDGRPDKVRFERSGERGGKPMCSTRWPDKGPVTAVSVLNAEGPPVPIPNTEVKLCSGDNTSLETTREDSSTLTQKEKNVRQKKPDGVGYPDAEGPPVPIPNTEVKLCSGDNTSLETTREDSS